MRHYESVIIVRPGFAGEGELTTIIDKCTGALNGDLAGVDKWGLKKLAYPIKKEQQGFYLLLRFSAAPDGVKEMERLLRIDDRILKYLTIRLIAPGGAPVPAEQEEEAESAAA